MRFCVVGAGVQGASVAAILAKDSEAESIVLADYDGALAARVAEKIGCERLTVAQVDATDVASLAAVARGSDVVLNIASYDIADRVRRGALEAGCNYVDSAAEPGFLQDLAFKGLTRDDGLFTKAGLCAVACAGWSPGVTNALVRRLADQLDEVHAVCIRLGFDLRLWVDPAEVAHPFRPHWSPEGALEDFAKQSLQFTGGKPTRVGPFANPEVYDFGGRIGELTLTSHDHDEAYTLPHFIGKTIRECDVRYPVNDQAATLIAMGMGNPERVVELKDGSTVKPFDVVMALVRRPAEEAFFAETREAILASEGFDRAIHIELTGRQGDEVVRARIAWYLPANPEARLALLETFGTANVTVGVPMIVTAKMIARGEVSRGVSLPEQLDATRFLEDLAATGYPLDLHEERTLSAAT